MTESGQVPPKAFLSYSHDSEAHKAWVLRLAHRLRGHGVDVVLDQWDIEPGTDLPLFMEAGLTSSEWVLVVCTQQYNEKANARTGGSGAEARIISADLLAHERQREQVVPLLRDPTARPELPNCLKGQVWIDFREDMKVDRSYEQLLRHIYRTPAVPKPPLGVNPFALSDADLWVPLGHRPDKYVCPAASGRFEFPYENNSGCLVLGSGDYRFTTKWSTAGQRGIHFYRDPTDIHSIALAVDCGIDGAGDVFQYDSSSRSRTAREGDVALFRNRHDYWLAVAIESVTVRTQHDSVARLKASYRILTDRSTEFSDLNAAH